MSLLQAQSVITPSANAPTPMRPMTRVRDPPPEKKGALVGEGDGEGEGDCEGEEDMVSFVWC